jgi:hypothetical protein
LEGDLTRPGKYGKADERYEDSPTQVKHREERNLARSHVAKASGKKLSGDVAHFNPLSGGGSNTRSNVHVETVAKNRGWRKGESGYKVPTEKKKK